MPALLTNTSTPPSCFAASAIICSICVRSPTLQTPVFRPLSSAAADFNASSLMSHVYTSAPERMNAAAICFPIPDAPAVTRTLRDMADLQLQEEVPKRLGNRSRRHPAPVLLRLQCQATRRDVNV